MPLFLFNLLELMGVEYELDVDEVNERWAGADHTDAWSQFILKQTDATVELITQAPPSGIWRMAGDGSIAFARRRPIGTRIGSEDEAFHLPIASEADHRLPGADLGILVARGRMWTPTTS